MTPLTFLGLCQQAFISMSLLLFSDSGLAFSQGGSITLRVEAVAVYIPDSKTQTITFHSI